MLDQNTYLYVEDEPMSQEIMRMIMAHGMGIDTLTIFSDSQDFMKRALALQPRPDVILLDIHVKPLDGFDMLHALRASAAFRSAKIIALTASVMSEEVEKLRLSEFDGAIAKPLNMHSFPDLIRQIIDGAQVWHVAD